MDAALTSKDRKIQVLITDVSNYLGSQIAESFLLQNCAVFGIGKNPLYEDLINKENFTLLEIDLSQPLPSHLPKFDFILYTNLLSSNSTHSFGTSTPPVLNSVASLANEESKVFIFSHLASDTVFFERIAKNPRSKGYLKLLLVGDVYGPKMLLESSKSSPFELSHLIYQAIETDKVVLEEEGLRLIYPIYITDAIFAIHKYTFTSQDKDTLFVSDDNPKTSLSVSYEIQNTLNIISGKNVGLFFSGPESQNKEIPHLDRKIHLDFSPKVHLSEGLMNTFEYFLKEKMIEANSHPKIELQKVNESPTDQKNYQSKEELPEPPARKLKMPSIAVNSRFKFASFGILLILVITVLKTGLDLFLAANSLKASNEALLIADFDKAKVKAKSSSNSFQAAYNKTKILTYPLLLVKPKASESVINPLLSAQAAAFSLVYLSEGSQQLAKNYEVIITKKDGQEKLDLESPVVNFQKAYFEAARAQELLRKSQNAGILTGVLTKSWDNLQTLVNLSSSLLEVSIVTHDLTGAGGAKTYLVLLQNNSELRPGGGFIGNYALVEFDDGYLKNISVDDIYNIDGQLKETIKPPPQLTEKLGTEKLYLRDSNWSLDFNLNSATARDFFKKETGKNVDGVIAIDLTVMQKVLQNLGPLKLDDYKEEISSENLFERGEYYSEIGFFPGSTQKKDFFGALTRKMVDKFTEETKTISWSQIAGALKDGLSQKHVLVTFDDPKLSAFIQTHGWDHSSPPKNFDLAENTTETRDFVALSEANLGANKVNRFLERKISYEQTIGRDANLVGKLTITYINKSEAETWPAGEYVNYLRVYVPAGSDLFEVKNGDNSDLKNVQVTNQGSLATFATYVEVPVKSTKEVVFSYRIPKNINLESAPTYHLYIQKQPGTLVDPLEFTFNLPSYLKDEDNGKQNLKFTTDLSTDREFKIQVEKK